MARCFLANGWIIGGWIYWKLMADQNILYIIPIFSSECVLNGELEHQRVAIVILGINAQKLFEKFGRYWKAKTSSQQRYFLSLYTKKPSADAFIRTVRWFIHTFSVLFDRWFLFPVSGRMLSQIVKERWNVDPFVNWVVCGGWFEEEWGPDEDKYNWHIIQHDPFIVTNNQAFGK